MKKAIIIIMMCVISPMIHAQFKNKEGVCFYKPNKFLKFSFKPSLKSGTIKDYKIGLIDMRMKIYVMPRVQFVVGGKISGVNNNSCNCGIIIKLN